MNSNKVYINKSVRLKEYDYGHPGAYFVTICVKDWKCVFGEVLNGKMILNELGKIADNCIMKIPNHFHNTEISVHVIMPNHVHAIVNIFEDEPVGRRHACDSQRRAFDLQEDRKHPKLPIIIGSYKSAVSKEIHNSFPSSNFKWQTSYHDHIIGTDSFREYLLLHQI